jgi:hypothetical protein
MEVLDEVERGGEEAVDAAQGKFVSLRREEKQEGIAHFGVRFQACFVSVLYRKGQVSASRSDGVRGSSGDSNRKKKEKGITHLATIPLGAATAPDQTCRVVPAINSQASPSAGVNGAGSIGLSPRMLNLTI